MVTYPLASAAVRAFVEDHLTYRQAEPGHKSQYRFDPLDYEDEQSMERKAAAAKALSDRNAWMREIKRCYPDKNLAMNGTSLRGQLRPYKSFGVPDGRVRTVYYITLY